MQITNNECSYDRNRRLMRVVSFFYDLMQAHGFGQEKGGKYEGVGSLPLGSTQVVSVHDHKGHLTVTWGGKPSDTEMRCMERAWHEAGEELMESVTHEVL